MLTDCRLAIQLVVCALASVAAAAADAPPTAAAFAAEVDYGEPALSPDGGRIVRVARGEHGRTLIALDLGTGVANDLINATSDSFEISRCEFKSDVRVLCGFRGTSFSAGQPYPVSRLVALDAVGKPKPLVLFQNFNQNWSQYQDEILDYQVDDPKHVLIALSDDGGPLSSVWSLNVNNGGKFPVQHSSDSILDWRADRDGVVRAGWGYDKRRSIFIARDGAQHEWHTLGEWAFGQEDFEFAGFAPDPGSLLVSADNNGRAAIYQLDLAGKNPRKLLFANDQVDMGGAIYWPADRRMVGFTYETEHVNRVMIDDEIAGVYAAIDARLPNADNFVLGASRDGNRVLIKSVTDVRPADYLLFDRREKNWRNVGSDNPELPATKFAPMKPVRIPGPGGIMLPGYLTLPAGSEGMKVPLVVLPHAGPDDRDSWGWDFLVQFMASRGYAVLQVNFRGSTGYGKAWHDAGMQHWGTVMIDDITAATRWAIAEGVADPARTCIVGWGWGGYAALMSAVREPDLYHCAASIAGVSDLRAFAREDLLFYNSRKSMAQLLGTDDQELTSGSPRRNSSRIKIPVLFVHGDDDSVVPVEHSRTMSRLLYVKHQKHELVIIKDGNHSLSRAEWRETLLTRLEAFLAANIGGEK